MATIRGSLTEPVLLEFIDQIALREMLIEMQIWSCDDLGRLLGGCVALLYHSSSSIIIYEFTLDVQLCSL